MFDHKKYIDKFKRDWTNGITSNNSDLHINRSSLSYPAYKIIGVHKLTPQENIGKHNLFLEVLDKNGQRDKEAVIRWGWDGQRPGEQSPPVKLDKPDNEPAGNLAIWANQTIWAEVLDTFPTDIITNVHTRHADEGVGNTYGHFSYFVVWQLIEDKQTPQPPPEPDDCTELREAYAALHNKYNKLIEDIGDLLDRQK